MKGIGSIIHDSKLTDLVVISVIVGPCFSLVARFLPMDLAVTRMIIFLIETSVCHTVKAICSIIHDSKLTDLVVISVVVGPCFSLMASSLRMDLAVTRLYTFP